MKTLRTTKLFYSKWFYKNTLWFRGCYVFVQYSLSQLIDALTAKRRHPLYEAISLPTQWEPYILEMARFLAKFPKESFQLRIESNYLSIYTNDIELHGGIISDFHDDICESYSPDPSDMEIMKDPAVIMCKQYPFNTYRYKVFVKAFAFRGNRGERVEFINWMKSQHPKLTCTPNFQRWFITEWSTSDVRYFLVDDEHTLLLLRMFRPEIINKVHKFCISEF